MAADEPSAAALEGGRHGVDVVWRREQHDGGRALRHVGTDLVEERIVELGDPRLRDAPGDPSAHEPDREPGRPEERTASAPVRAPSAVLLPIGSRWSSTST